MDLSERTTTGAARHPWETARAEAVSALVGRLGLSAPRVLDIGCGDGYLIAQLERRLGFSEASGQDTHLTDELIRQLDAPNVRFVKRLDELSTDAPDLVLLLDVLEHIQDPVAFLKSEVLPRLKSTSRLLVTVPAFQALYTRHDDQLRHFRRYNRRDIAQVAADAGLDVTDSGYLFASLLLPRALRAIAERLLPARSAPSGNVDGIGGWNAPASLTRWIHRGLCADNHLCLKARDRGITLPGLSVWLACAPRP